MVVICVDDEPLVLLTLKIELRNLFKGKFSYETAINGAEALELIEELHKEKDEEIKIVLIISDYQMPIMNGYDFLKKVSEQYPNIRRIILTGQMLSSALNDALNKGYAETVLDKPWSKEKLSFVLNDILKEYNE